MFAILETVMENGEKGENNDTTSNTAKEEFLQSTTTSLQEYFDKRFQELEKNFHNLMKDFDLVK